VLVLDADGRERYRIEGYLPKDWFRARLEMAVARLDFMKKKFADAEKLYASIAEQHGDKSIAAEAIYWGAVCHYKATNDHTVLGEFAQKLGARFPEDEWALKGLPWAH
jgi:hypothetical protein